MAVFEDVRDVVVEQLNVPVESVKLESKIIEDLNADSLDVVELVMTLEEKFGIEIPENEAEKLLSIQDIVNFVENIQK